MESIFHEKQEGSLCAQHCLNNLLQGEYFSPVELSAIAQQLDEEERIRMAEGGVTSEEYRTFLQVISKALGVWGLELILFNSPEYQKQMADPVNEKAFICNYKEHWFTVRKLGRQWFNLNSLLTGPELISDTYLALFLAQLQQEGYSIFVIRGELPDCEADQILGIIRVEQRQRPRLIGEDASQLASRQRSPLDKTTEGRRAFEGGPIDEDEENLSKALALSQKDIEVEDEEADLRRAIQLSMQGSSTTGSSTDTIGDITANTSKSVQSESLSAEELRRRRQAYFEKQQPTPSTAKESQDTRSASATGDSSGSEALHKSEDSSSAKNRQLNTKDA
uniref:ubiquitinyl hydrolase 1 n=1 Tax=Erpetoichthys calabaricus TaxID=27687 RepID=A0A8C4STB7_ERPCA